MEHIQSQHAFICAQSPYCNQTQPAGPMNTDVNFDWPLDILVNQLMETDLPAPTKAVPVVLPSPDNDQTGNCDEWMSPGAEPQLLQLLGPMTPAPESWQSDQHSEAGIFIQGQENTLYQCPFNNSPLPSYVILPEAPVSQHDAECHWPVYNDHSSTDVMTLTAVDPFDNIQVIRVPQQHVTRNQQPARSLKRQTVEAVPPAAPRMKAKNSNSDRQRKYGCKQDEDTLHIKKPPNAFMLFLKEQRSVVMAHLNMGGSATVNKILGEKWKLLSDEEKDKYFEQARREARLHAQRFPEWSTSQNYGKKRKRIRAPTKAKM